MLWMAPQNVPSKVASQVGRVSQPVPCTGPLPLLTTRGFCGRVGLWWCVWGSPCISCSVVVVWKAEARPSVFRWSKTALTISVASKPLRDVGKGTGSFWTVFQLRGDLGVSHGGLAVQSCSGQAERHTGKLCRQNKTTFSIRQETNESLQHCSFCTLAPSQTPLNAFSIFARRHSL